MKKALWIGLAVSALLVTAACEPFAAANVDDYVIFDNCVATQPCQDGTKTILVLKDPDVTTASDVTTMEGDLQLRLFGRNGEFHQYAFVDSTVTVDESAPDQSSIEVGELTGGHRRVWLGRRAGHLRARIGRCHPGRHPGRQP